MSLIPPVNGVPLVGKDKSLPLLCQRYCLPCAVDLTSGVRDAGLEIHDRGGSRRDFIFQRPQYSVPAESKTLDSRVARPQYVAGWES
jgi:hypothetical protein